jgi:hypothetical protein
MACEELNEVEIRQRTDLRRTHIGQDRDGDHKRKARHEQGKGW